MSSPTIQFPSPGLIAGIAFCCGCVLICACNPVVSEKSTEEKVKPQITVIPPPGSRMDARETHDLSVVSYVDDAECADCHQEIFDSYQHSGMARSFYDFDPDNIVEDFVNNEFHHKASNNHYRMEIVDGNLRMSRYRKRSDGSEHYTHQQTAQYVVGSGNHVRTYLYRNQVGEMFQLPVVWYTQDKKWGMAPGYDRPDHRDFHRPITRHCMFCHNAYPEFEEGSDEFGQPHLFPEKMPQGLGCQRCHGPGSEHVRLAIELNADDQADLTRIQDSIVNTGKMNDQAQDDVCFQCHLQPMSQRTSFVRKFGQGDYEYHAGESLGNFMLHFEPDRDNQLANHFEINHHPYRLRQSKCFLESLGGIRCTTCHDPHKTVPKLERPSFYRQKCWTCHQQKDCLDVENGHQPDADCVSCHMPNRRTTDVVNVTMTDHKIVRSADLKSLAAPLEEIDVPIDMPIRHYSASDSIPSEKEKRIYELFARAMDDDESSFAPLEKEIFAQDWSAIEPNLQLAQKLIQHRKFEQTERLFDNIRNQGGKPPALQSSIGVSAIGKGELEAGIRKLEKSLQLYGDDATAWYNLGVAYTKSDRPNEAFNCLEKAIELRPNYVKPRLKLGSQLALQDRYKEAEKHFAEALALDVRNVEAYLKLSSTLRRQKRWKSAMATIEDGLLIHPRNVKMLEDLLLCLLDVRNSTARNPVKAIDISKRFAEQSEDLEYGILIQALAHLESKQPQAALKLLSQIIANEEHKPEIGLIISIAQQQIGSMESAKTNYEGARKAFNIRDRWGRVLVEYANAAFAGQSSSSD